VLLAVPPATVLALVVAARRPRLAAGLTLSAPAAAAAAAVGWRRPWRDVVAFAALAPPFALAYTAGIWRGGLLLLRARGRR
jgi:hypothetical protein